MNFTASIRRLPLLVLVLAISQPAYGQESLPETVGRHEKEIISLQQKLDQLESALIILEGQGMVGSGGSESSAKQIYFTPVRNNTISCRVSKSSVSYGKNDPMSFMSVATFEAVSDNIPYDVNVTIYCAGRKIECRTSGLVNLQEKISFAFQVERVGTHACSVTSIELQ